MASGMQAVIHPVEGVEGAREGVHRASGATPAYETTKYVCRAMVRLC
jgi:hypothetical protein